LKKDFRVNGAMMKTMGEGTILKAGLLSDGFIGKTQKTFKDQVYQGGKFGSSKRYVG